MKVPLARVLIENKTTKLNTYLDTVIHVVLLVYIRLVSWFACMPFVFVYADWIRVEYSAVKTHKTWQPRICCAHSSCVLCHEENIGENISIGESAEQRCWLLERKQTKTTLLFWWMICASRRTVNILAEFKMNVHSSGVGASFGLVILDLANTEIISLSQNKLCMKWSVVFLIRGSLNVGNSFGIDTANAYICTRTWRARSHIYTMAHCTCTVEHFHKSFDNNTR